MKKNDVLRNILLCDLVIDPYSHTITYIMHHIKHLLDYYFGNGKL